MKGLEAWTRESTKKAALTAKELGDDGLISDEKALLEKADPTYQVRQGNVKS